MNKKHILIERAPTKDEYLRLREAAGWGSIDSVAVETGLSNSLFSVCAVFENKVIGCGRIIGDSGIYFYIQDVIVLPEFQGQGIGRSIMDALMDYLRKHAGAHAFVGLMAAKGAASFYKQFGFEERPSDGPGMFMVMGAM